MKTLAAEFDASLLAAVDEAQARETVFVTKDGRNVAKLVPMTVEKRDPIFGFYKGKLEIKGDILSPIDSDEENEEFFERSAAQLK